MQRILIAVALTASAVPQTAVHGQDSIFAQARSARFAGRIDEADRLLRQVLRAEPNHYLALYNMGLVFEARAVRAPGGAARQQHYRTAAEWLERAYRSPQRDSAGADAYTIYNSLGWIYLGFGNLDKADLYLKQGLANEKQLSDFSRGRLYGSVGYLHALQGNSRQARLYFERGARLGSNFSRINLQRLNAAGIR